MIQELFMTIAIIAATLIFIFTRIDRLEKEKGL